MSGKSIPEFVSELRGAVESVAADASLILRACEANPWFVPPVASRALRETLPWFQPETVLPFLENYPGLPATSGLKTGLILAGNVPAVGLHDIYMALLAGDDLQIKLSHKDSVLIQAILSRLSAQTRQRIEYKNELNPAEIHRLIATGSNNALRYFEHGFPGIPALLRHNRFSVAVFNRIPAPPIFNKLAEDVLLHCGMGCRNVSVILLDDSLNCDEFSAAFSFALNHYPNENLPSGWIDAVNWERGLAQTRGEWHYDAGKILLRQGKRLLPGPTGTLTLVNMPADQHSVALAASENQLQCVVGEENDYLPAGITQQPGIGDFADNRDTLSWLLDISNKN